jgi:digeranylgeranylglycerophospholipid reductase
LSSKPIAETSGCILMKEVSDVVIVGGGPSGSFAALKLARLGVNVTVYEEHREVGVPSHCAGHVSIRGLKHLRMHPLPVEIVENTFRGAVFYSPTGKRFSVRLASPATCAVNRALFEKYLAEKAQDAGADYCLDSRVESLIIEDGTVKGVVVRKQGGIEKKLAKIVIDAEGVSSRLLRQTGLRGPRQDGLVNGIEAEVENVRDTQLDTVEVFLGADYAPGFYAWLIPKKDARAKVGLAAKTGKPKEFLQKLMVKHPVVSKKMLNSKIAKVSVHPITLGGPIPKAHSNGFLVVGDAASQVKSTTGGGVIFGMTCAAAAAEVACEAIRQNDFSSRILSAYRRRCDEALGFDSKVMLRMRKALDAMSDRRLDGLIGLCTRLGLDKTLQKVEDIDFQGRALLHVLRSPRVLAALSYFFLSFLFANV